MNIDREKLNETLQSVTRQLLDKRVPQGHWVGQLSSSALSTATAVFAFAMVDRDKYSSLISNGIQWLIDTQNADGGWGDTTESVSNLPTTLLCWAAIEKTGLAAKHSQSVEQLKAWVCQEAGSCQPSDIVQAVDMIYGNDRTFSVPILTMCTLAGLLRDDKSAWKHIKPLPFELAAVSPKLFKRLRLSVVSYAMPALIAMGQINYHYRKPRNPFARLLRHLTRNKTLNLLEKIQPDSGGFLEAIPLTSFVVMTLVGAGNVDNEVVKKGVGFLARVVKDDGSWAIDTNLATWVTTLSVNALPNDGMTETEKRVVKNWLLDQQHKEVHPYTNADPGGWAWTDTSGGVPDADDTPGVLIALRNLGRIDEETKSAATAGIKWLMGLQNSDGGIPTFCKGWNRLPFDKSSPDLTSHAIAALSCWADQVEDNFAYYIDTVLKVMIDYLKNSQNKNGSWMPLWFGNQFAANQKNPVYGTSRVLLGLSKVELLLLELNRDVTDRAMQYLLSVQNDDGGFGGDKDVKSSIEETALAVDALACMLDKLEHSPLDRDTLEKAIECGVNWLIERIETGEPIKPSPIGLYFAKLWYTEELYPLIFTVSALKSCQSIY